MSPGAHQCSGRCFWACINPCCKPQKSSAEHPTPVQPDPQLVPRGAILQWAVMRGLCACEIRLETNKHKAMHGSPVPQPVLWVLILKPSGCWTGCPYLLALVLFVRLPESSVASAGMCFYSGNPASLCLCRRPAHIVGSGVIRGSVLKEKGKVVMSGWSRGVPPSNPGSPPQTWPDLGPQAPRRRFRGIVAGGGTVVGTMSSSWFFVPAAWFSATGVGSVTTKRSLSQALE